MPTKGLWSLTGAGLLTLCCGCTSAETLWLGEPPDSTNALSSVWFITWDGGEFVEAVSAGTGGNAIQFPALPWTGGPPDQFQVTAAFYQDSLVDLGLSEGRLSPATEARACLGNTPSAVYEAEFENGQPSEWIQVDGLTGPQRTFLTMGDGCIRSSSCRTFGVEVVSLPAMEGGTQFLPLDDGRLLMSQDQRSFVIIGPDGTVEPQPQLDGLPSFAMARHRSGDILLAGRAGGLARGPLNGPFAESVVLEGRFNLVALATVSDDSDALYAIGVVGRPSRAAVLFFDGLRWDILWEDEVDNFETVQSRLLKMQSGRFLGVYGGRFVVVIDGRSVTLVDATANAPVGSGRANTITAFVDENGIESYYVGGSDSFLYRARANNPTDWEVVGSAQFFGGIIGLDSIPGGLLLGGEAGVVQAFYPGEGFCDSQQAASSDAEIVANFPDAIVVSGGAIMPGNAATVTFLRN